jgi:ribosome-associated heat shock protein Hsp15
MDEREEPIRIDKWLWAARFFKTRSLAAEAVAGGKVEVSGARAKPSRIVRPGDQISIRRGPYEWTVTVKELSRQRGPASEAQDMYVETDESRRKREATAAQLRLERPPDLELPGRPSKKDRRAIQRFTKKNW